MGRAARYEAMITVWGESLVKLTRSIKVYTPYQTFTLFGVYSHAWVEKNDIYKQ